MENLFGLYKLLEGKKNWNKLLYKLKLTCAEDYVNKLILAFGKVSFVLKF